jgi:hypothetical protein
MKLKLLVLIVFASVTLFQGCSKDDETTTTPPPPVTTGGLLTAKINGAAWAPSADSSSAALMNGEINITGVASDGKTITMTLTDTVTGYYDLGFSGNSAGVYQTSPTGGSSFDSNFGPWDSTVNYVHITSIDKVNKKMSGTFAFKATNTSNGDSVTISQGAFNNLPYLTSIVSTGNNSFTVTIDGSVFVPSLISGVVSGSNINIIASDSTGSKSVGLYLPETITPGTYNLQAFGTYNAQYNPNGSTFLAVDSGTVIVTEHNTSTQKIVGTFSFTATEFPTGPLTANLTNGGFTIYY